MVNLLSLPGDLGDKYPRGEIELGKSILKRPDRSEIQGTTVHWIAVLIQNLLNNSLITYAYVELHIGNASISN